MGQVDEQESDDDREDPLPEDIVDGDDPETEECPFCFRLILEATDICPYCGQFISREDLPRRRGFWGIVGMVGIALVIVMWVLQAFRP